MWLSPQMSPSRLRVTDNVCHLNKIFSGHSHFSLFFTDYYWPNNVMCPNPQSSPARPQVTDKVCHLNRRFSGHSHFSLFLTDYYWPNNVMCPNPQSSPARPQVSNIIGCAISMGDFRIIVIFPISTPLRHFFIFLRYYYGSSIIDVRY